MNRFWALICTVAVAGAALLGCVLAVTGARSSDRAFASGPVVLGDLQSGATYTMYVPSIASLHDPTYVSPFGVRMAEGVNVDRGLVEIQAAGIDWVHVDFHWMVIEPAPGVYNWSSFETDVTNASRSGMDVFVMFTGNPAWAAPTGEGPVTDMAALVSTARLMAERYDCDGVNDAPESPCVHYWSFYAEPDRDTRWGYNGAGFAAMLSQVAPAMHQADPKAQVLIGGLAYDWFVGEDGGHFVRSFLADTLRALNHYPGGAAAYVDAVAFHYYPISEVRWPTIREKALEVRGIMNEYGVGNLPLIVPEAAYWSSPLWGSNEAKQARRLVQMYVRGMSEGIQNLLWYRVFDDTEPGGASDLSADKTCGLLRVDRSLKPSFYAYQAMASELHGARYAAGYSVSGVEGYVFHMPSGKQKTVMWATGADLNWSFPYACLRKVSIEGNALLIPDGDKTNDLDGKLDGRVTTRIRNNDPVYLSSCQ
jgi:hypothetical protein